MSNGPTITIGNCAGHHFHGQADLEVLKHCTRGTQRGYYHQRKRLVDRKAFAYDPRFGLGNGSVV